MGRISQRSARTCSGEKDQHFSIAFKMASLKVLLQSSLGTENDWHRLWKGLLAFIEAVNLCHHCLRDLATVCDLADALVLDWSEPHCVDAAANLREAIEALDTTPPDCGESIALDKVCYSDDRVAVRLISDDKMLALELSQAAERIDDDVLDVVRYHSEFRCLCNAQLFRARTRFPGTTSVVVAAKIWPLFSTTVRLNCRSSCNSSVAGSTKPGSSPRSSGYKSIMCKFFAEQARVRECDIPAPSDVQASASKLCAQNASSDSCYWSPISDFSCDPLLLTHVNGVFVPASLPLEQQELAASLVQDGVPVASVNIKKMQSVLFEAATRSTLTILEWFTHYGVVVTMKDYRYELLRGAAAGGHKPEVLKWLIKQGVTEANAILNDLYPTNKSEDAIFHLGHLVGGSRDVVHISAGCAILSMDSQHLNHPPTPDELCLSSDSDKSQCTLIQSIADKLFRKGVPSSKSEIRRMQSVMLDAARDDRVDLLEWFRQRGVEPTMKEYRYELLRGVAMGGHKRRVLEWLALHGVGEAESIFFDLYRVDVSHGQGLTAQS